MLTQAQRPNTHVWRCKKTIAVNPWPSIYRLAVAHNCYRAGDWPGAAAACREALRLNPDLVEARSLLVQCYVRSREPDKADAEFQILIHCYPASRDIWQQWYEQQKQAAQGWLLRDWRR